MRTRVLVMVAGLGFVAGCPDPGLEPLRFCQETLSQPIGGDTCSVDYVECPNTSTCSFRVDCTVTGGTTSCHCAANDPATGCHIDRSFTIETDLCGAVGAGDRASARDAIFKPCLRTTPADVDFSKI